MPAAAMLIPLAIQAGGAIASHYAGKKATKSAMERSPEELAALTGAQGSAKTLGDTGGSLVSEGRQCIQRPAGYYQTLLSGNRAAMTQATAAPRAQLQEQVRGARTGVARSGIRGAARDVLSGNLMRQNAAQIGGLTTGVQPAAAAALAGLGTDTMKVGAPMLGQAGSIYTNLLGQGANNRAYGREEGERTSRASWSWRPTPLTSSAGR